MRRRTQPSSAPAGPRVVHLYKGQLLVARLQNTPGPVLPTVTPTDFKPPEQHAWASGQCFSVEWEEDLRKALAASKNFDDLLKRLKHFKYRVDEDTPGFKKRPFFRL